MGLWRRGCRGKRLVPADPRPDPGMTNLQWGRDEGVAENSDRARLQVKVATRLGASQWGRDEGVAENAGQLRDTGRRLQAKLNVAATMVSRKTSNCARLLEDDSGRPAFNGGRDEGVAENKKVRFSHLVSRAGRKASPGPRRGCRGKPSGCPAERHRSANELQRGRDEGVVEIAGPFGLRCPTLPSDRLQWGRDEGVAERLIEAKQEAAREVTSASMGPRRGCRGQRWTSARIRLGRADLPLQWAATRVSRKTGIHRRQAAGRGAARFFNGAATRVSRKTSGQFLPGSTAVGNPVHGAATRVSRKTQPRRPPARHIHVSDCSMGPRRRSAAENGRA